MKTLKYSGIIALFACIGLAIIYGWYALPFWIAGVVLYSLAYYKIRLSQKSEAVAWYQGLCTKLQKNKYLNCFSRGDLIKLMNPVALPKPKFLCDTKETYVLHLECNFSVEITISRDLSEDDNTGEKWYGYWELGGCVLYDNGVKASSFDIKKKIVVSHL